MTTPTSFQPATRLRFCVERSDYRAAGVDDSYLDAWPAHPELFPPSLGELSRVHEERLAFYQASPRRSALVEALRAAYRRLGLSGDELLAKLSRPDCMAILSGQQAGLLMGPLYTHLKIMGTIRLAEVVPFPAVPVFWNAAEDADLSEIADVVVPGRGGPAVYRLEVSRYPEGTMAASVPASDFDLEEFARWWETELRRTDFTDGLFTLLRSTQAASASLGDWMTRLVHHFYGDRLLIVDPSWPELKPLGLGLVECELDRPNATAEEVNGAGKLLQAIGLPPRIHRPQDRTSFFFVRDGVRHRITWRDGRLHFDNESMAVEEFMQLLGDDPRGYSAGATFRPILQDALLPTVVTCLGPGELAYHCQLGGAYLRLGVPRPAVVLRPSATLLEPPAAARLEKLGLDWRELAQPVEHLGKSLAADGEGAVVTQELAALRAQTGRVMASLRQEAHAIDAGLPAALDKQEKNLLKVLDQVEDLLMRRLRDRNQSRMEQLAGLAALLFPDGGPQERRLNLFYFLNKYGPLFVKGLCAALPATGEPVHALVRWRVEAC